MKTYKKVEIYSIGKRWVVEEQRLGVGREIVAIARTRALARQIAALLRR